MRIISKNASNRLKESIPLGIFCGIVNIRHIYQRRPTRLRPTGHDQVFEAYDVSESPGLVDARIYACRRMNRLSYRYGVAWEINRLVKRYGLGKIPLKEGGVLVDCGANIGELGNWARQHGLRYIAFEPEPLEANCNDLNNFNGEHKTMRVALWNRNEKIPLYSKPNDADSSLIDMGNAAVCFQVTAARLDSMLNVDNLVSGVRILKVEAEGAEPEVLQGASNILRSFDYILIDCGPERGVAQVNTLVESNNELLNHGFSMFHANAPRLIVGYKRSMNALPDATLKCKSMEGSQVEV